ncbi:Transposase [Theobroma cacao]|nr:Transposase [Theobroma cacao]
MLALKVQFGLRVKRSCKARYEVGCKDKACKFSVRATKLPEEGEYWQVRTFHKVHTCTVDALRPKDIIGEMRVQWGLECLYGKAWQAKEYAKKLVLGTITAVATDEVERFKYCFWAYEASILGFRDVMHLTVAIDATHLKGKFKGVLFVAVCKDANECVYLVVFFNGHVEDENSWTLFLSKLRDAVGYPENTMFIFYQHLGIKKAIQNAYPEAHHGLCGYHLKKNFKNKFRSDDVSMIFTLVQDCYKVSDFNRHMNQLKQIHVGAHANLMRIGPER